MVDIGCQVVDYTNTEVERYNKRVRICNAIAMLLMVVYTIHYADCLRSYSHVAVHKAAKDAA